MKHSNCTRERARFQSLFIAFKIKEKQQKSTEIEKQTKPTKQNKKKTNRQMEYSF